MLEVNRKWKLQRTSNKGDMGYRYMKAVSAADEGFVLAVLEVYYDKWKEAHDTQADQTKGKKAGDTNTLQGKPDSLQGATRWMKKNAWDVATPEGREHIKDWNGGIAELEGRYWEERRKARGEVRNDATGADDNGGDGEFVTADMNEMISMLCDGEEPGDDENEDGGSLDGTVGETDEV